MDGIKYGVIAVIIFCLILAFITKDSSSAKDIQNKNVTVSDTFKTIVDPDTNVVYIDNRTHNWYHVYTPYYGENGKICKYEDGRIVEIEE